MHRSTLGATAPLLLLCACGVHTPAGYQTPRYAATLTAPVHAPDADEQIAHVKLKKIVAKPVRGKPGEDLYGLTTYDGEVLLQPEFPLLFVPCAGVAIARPAGADRCQRIDLESGERTELPFGEMRLVISAARPDRGPTTRVGVERQDDGRWTVHLLDPEGRVGATLHDVHGREFEGERPPIDYLAEGGYVVRFDPPDGERCDMLFGASGQPFSPELPPLVRLLPAQDAGTMSKQHAIVLDEAAGLLWPVLPDGSIYPMPDDAIGLRVLPDASAPRGWAIGWRTDAGDRWAIEPNLAIDAEALLASRERAQFTDVAIEMRDVAMRAGYAKAVPTWLSRDADTGTTMAYDHNGGELDPVFTSAQHSMSGALRELRRLSNAARSEARAIAKLAREEHLRRVRAAEQRAAAEKAARLAQYSANVAIVASQIASGNFASAENLAWQTSPQAMVDVVVAALRAGRIDQLQLSTIEAVQHRARKQDRGAVRQALSARRAQLHQMRIAARPSGSYSTPVGAGGYRAPSYRPAPQRNYMQEMRDRVRMNYLSGKQNWYFSGSVVRR